MLKISTPISCPYNIFKTQSQNILRVLLLQRLISINSRQSIIGNKLFTHESVLHIHKESLSLNDPNNRL